MSYKNSIVKFCVKTLFVLFLSYSCLLHADGNDLEQTTAPQNNNENNTSLISRDFISGVKEGCVLPATFFLLLLPTNIDTEAFFSGNGLKLKASDLDAENMKNNVLNPTNILRAFTIIPLAETFIFNCIIQNALDDLTRLIVPKSLSNKKVHDKLLELSQRNIPLFNKLFNFLSKEVENYDTVSENSSSFIQESLGSGLLGSIYLLLSGHEYFVSKLIKIYEVISESDIYRRKGYLSALAYKLGFNFSTYSILYMLFLYKTYLN